MGKEFQWHKMFPADCGGNCLAAVRFEQFNWLLNFSIGKASNRVIDSPYANDAQ